MNWISELVRPRIKTLFKRETPENLWIKCPDTGQMVFHKEVEANLWVIPGSDHHLRVTATQRLKMMFDQGTWLDVPLPDVTPDPLKFRDEKRYADRLKEARTKTGMIDAFKIGFGRVGGLPMTIAVQDFAFMGGTVGTAAGEAFVRGAETALDKRTPYVVFASSGGMRMQEGVLSLMQMPRTTVAVRRLAAAKLPYIVVLTNPTTGGVTASYAMLGDVHLAEPGALIGFAGPRVIEQTIREKLPEGFQRAEYLKEHGMVDQVVHRHALKDTIARLGHLLTKAPVARGRLIPRWNSSDALIARFLALHPKTIDLSLGRIERLLALLGHPERRLPPVIHVAGTNGKGSTIAFMRAILEAGGLACHVYTSPHLVRFHERIRLGRVGGGRFVGEQRLVEALRQCEAVNAAAPITVFEITTAAAILLFSQEPADVLLLEVGLGGRLDATNVIAAPAATIITPIGRDHAEYLGDTVEEVAREKAGIFKRGVPAVIAPQDYREADRVLVEAAERAGARPIHVGGQDFVVSEERGRLVFQDEDGLLDLPLPKLAGRHQFTNAGTAIAGLRAAGYADLGVSSFEAGILRAEWPGRLQRLVQGRLPKLAPPGTELWLDGGHNIDGGRILAAAMADLQERSDAPLVLVVGLLGTKDAAGFLRNFVGLARTLVAVPIDSQVAARPASEVAAVAAQVGLVASTAPTVEAALAGLDDTVWERPPRVLVCGSLYLAGQVLAANGTLPA